MEMNDSSETMNKNISKKRNETSTVSSSSFMGKKQKLDPSFKKQITEKHQGKIVYPFNDDLLKNLQKQDSFGGIEPCGVAWILYGNTLFAWVFPNIDQYSYSFQLPISKNPSTRSLVTFLTCQTASFSFYQSIALFVVTSDGFIRYWPSLSEPNVYFDRILALDELSEDTLTNKHQSSSMTLTHITSNRNGHIFVAGSNGNLFQIFIASSAEIGETSKTTNYSKNVLKFSCRPLKKYASGYSSFLSWATRPFMSSSSSHNKASEIKGIFCDQVNVFSVTSDFKGEQWKIPTSFSSLDAEVASFVGELDFTAIPKRLQTVITSKQSKQQQVIQFLDVIYQFDIRKFSFLTCSFNDRDEKIKASYQLWIPTTSSSTMVDQVDYSDDVMAFSCNEIKNYSEPYSAEAFYRIQMTSKEKFALLKNHFVSLDVAHAELFAPIVGCGVFKDILFLLMPSIGILSVELDDYTTGNSIMTSTSNTTIQQNSLLGEEITKGFDSQIEKLKVHFLKYLQNVNSSQSVRQQQQQQQQQQLLSSTSDILSTSTLHGLLLEDAIIQFGSLLVDNSLSLNLLLEKTKAGSRSLLILESLEKREFLFTSYLQFLKETSLWDNVPSKKRSTLLDYGVKLRVAVIIRRMQSGERFQFKNDDKLNSYYEKVTDIENVFPFLIQLEETKMETCDSLEPILQVNSIFLEMFEAAQELLDEYHTAADDIVNSWTYSKNICRELEKQLKICSDFNGHNNAILLEQMYMLATEFLDRVVASSNLTTGFTNGGGRVRDNNSIISIIISYFKGYPDYHYLLASRYKDFQTLVKLCRNEKAIKGGLFNKAIDDFSHDNAFLSALFYQLEKEGATKELIALGNRFSQQLQSYLEDEHNLKLSYIYFVKVDNLSEASRCMLKVAEKNSEDYKLKQSQLSLAKLCASKEPLGHQMLHAMKELEVVEAQDYLITKGILRPEKGKENFVVPAWDLVRIAIDFSISTPDKSVMLERFQIALKLSPRENFKEILSCAWKYDSNLRSKVDNLEFLKNNDVEVREAIHRSFFFWVLSFALLMHKDFCSKDQLIDFILNNEKPSRTNNGNNVEKLEYILGLIWDYSSNPSVLEEFSF